MKCSDCKWYFDNSYQSFNDIRHFYECLYEPMVINIDNRKDTPCSVFEKKEGEK